ncbi:MAG: hypothetical protein RBG13Loki_1847, partial [Promethearchaeota archaeon CR_4]
VFHRVSWVLHEGVQAAGLKNLGVATKMLESNKTLGCLCHLMKINSRRVIQQNVTYNFRPMNQANIRKLT